MFSSYGKRHSPLRTHERTLGITLAAGLLGVSVLGTRHPHLLAWPLATVGGLWPPGSACSAPRGSNGRGVYRRILAGELRSEVQWLPKSQRVAVFGKSFHAYATRGRRAQTGVPWRIPYFAS